MDFLAGCKGYSGADGHHEAAGGMHPPTSNSEPSSHSSEGGKEMWGEMLDGNKGRGRLICTSHVRHHSAATTVLGAAAKEWLQQDDDVVSATGVRWNGDVAAMNMAKQTMGRVADRGEKNDEG